MRRMKNYVCLLSKSGEAEDCGAAQNCGLTDLGQSCVKGKGFGAPSLAMVTKFTALRTDAITHPSPTLDMTSQIERQTAVLTPQMAG